MYFLKFTDRFQMNDKKVIKYVANEFEIRFTKVFFRIFVYAHLYLLEYEALS